MNDDIKMGLDDAKHNMQHTVDHLKSELVKVRAGKASPAMLEGVLVEYYGSMTPITQVANISTPDSRTITVQPWEKGILDSVAKGIINSNVGLNPQDNGDMIIINVPPLTEERRKDLVKTARAEGEKAKVSIRNHRKEAMDYIKGLKNDGLSEDLCKDAENEVQKIVDLFTKKIDELIEGKEKDIMTV